MEQKTMNNENIFEYEGKKVYIKPAPATVGYDVALRYRGAMGDESTGKPEDAKVLQECLFELLKYAELDLGDGRRVKLDNAEIINQHFKRASTLMTMQRDTVSVNFGFLADGGPSGS